MKRSVVTEVLTLSYVIMRLEDIARAREVGLLGDELAAQGLQEVGELCFRLANKVRRGDA